MTVPLSTQGGLIKMLQPTVVELDDPVPHVFAVPVDDAVGTNDLDNAITVLRFRGDLVEADVVRKEFFKYVSGGELCFLPLFDDRIIGYAQSRRFVIFDVTNGSFTQYMICSDLEEVIERITVVDAGRRCFLFEIGVYAPGANHDRVRVIRLGGDAPAELADIRTGLPGLAMYSAWTADRGRLLVFNGEVGALRALDLELEPSSHPLVAMLSRNEQPLGRLHQLAVHPSLPLAVLVIGERDSPMGLRCWLARWEHPDVEQRLVPLFSSGVSCSEFQFSPDGRWLIFKDSTHDHNNPDLVAVPVRASYPDAELLGAPRALGSLEPGSVWGQYVWTRRPQCLVVTGGEHLYRWDLRRVDDHDHER